MNKGEAFKLMCFRIAAVVISLLLVTLFLELTLHFLLPHNYVHWGSDDEMGTDNYPGVHARHVTSEYNVDYIINTQGNRGTLADESQEKQIVVLGDSMTLGTGVQEEHLYSHVLGEMTGIPVINLGMGGAEPEQLYKRLVTKFEELPLKPEVIIYTICFNDLGDIGAWDLLEYDYNDKTVKWKKFKKPFLFDLRIFLARNSRIYHVLFIVKTRSKFADFLRQDNGKLPRGITPGIDESFLERVVKMDVIMHLMKKVAASHSSELIIVYAPGKYEVDERKLAELMVKYNVTEERLGVDIVRGTLKELAVKNNITFLDLTEGMRTDNINNTFYFEEDVHWNEEGHRYAARQIYQEIQPLMN